MRKRCWGLASHSGQLIVGEPGSSRKPSVSPQAAGTRPVLLSSPEEQEATLAEASNLPSISTPESPEAGPGSPKTKRTHPSGDHTVCHVQGLGNCSMITH